MEWWVLENTIFLSVLLPSYFSPNISVFFKFSTLIMCSWIVSPTQEHISPQSFFPIWCVVIEIWKFSSTNCNPNSSLPSFVFTLESRYFRGGSFLFSPTNYSYLISSNFQMAWSEGSYEAFLLWTMASVTGSHLSGWFSCGMVGFLRPEIPINNHSLT